MADVQKSPKRSGIFHGLTAAPLAALDFFSELKTLMTVGWMFFDYFACCFLFELTPVYHV